MPEMNNVTQHLAPAVVDSVAESLPGASATELEAFLINFVVEQTGYPAEVVELDADLEADLGIDSIKKAQLFGELQEYFDVTPDENLTLDDFPTLRHVVKFLERSTSTGNSPASAPNLDQETQAVPQFTEPAASCTTESNEPELVQSAATTWRVIRFGADSAEGLRRNSSLKLVTASSPLQASSR